MTNNKGFDSITLADYKKMVSSAPLVLVSFGAIWCGPCKKLHPALASLGKDEAVTLVNIDVDENNEVAEHFKIDRIPHTKLYKNGKEVWKKEGFDEKMFKSEMDEVREVIKKNK